MQREELEKWIDTQTTRKRPLEDFSTGGRRKKPRVETSLSGLRDDHSHLAYQNSLCQPSFTKANSKFKRSRSEGDLPFYRKESRLKTKPISPTFLDNLKGDLETTDTLEMEKNAHYIAPPSPTSSQASAMLPPPRPPSQASSRARSSSTTTSKKADVTSSSYRTKVLQPNRIFIGYYDTPEDILDTVSRIVHQERSSPELSDEEAIRITRVACDLVNEGEQNIIDALIPELFPQPQNNGAYSKLKRNAQLPFNSYAVPGESPPEGLQLYRPAIPTPNPDVAYGYNIDAFTKEQQMAQSIVNEKANLSRLSETSKDLYWGWFVLEFKAQATGGTLWAATNQCAGGGSTCTNASSQLFSLARGEESRRTDSISFSMAIDGQTASLYVHWHEEGKGFYLHQVEAYLLTKAEGITKIKRHAKNIAEWGLGVRLDTTKTALDKFLADELAKVQSAKKRNLAAIQ
jgi:hypothetical protein